MNRVRKKIVGSTWGVISARKETELKDCDII